MENEKLKNKKKFELLFIHFLTVSTRKILYIIYLLASVFFTTILIKLLSIRLEVKPETIINFIGLILIAEAFARWREGIKFLLYKFLHILILIILYVFSLNNITIEDLNFSVIFLIFSFSLYYIGTKILNRSFEGYLFENIIEKDSLQNIIQENSSFEAIEKINKQLINPLYKDYVELTSLNKESSTSLFYINKNRLLAYNYNYNLVFSIFLYKRVEDLKIKLANINILKITEKLL